jgi:hypothetical protein
VLAIDRYSFFPCFHANYKELSSIISFDYFKSRYEICSRHMFLLQMPCANSFSIERHELALWRKSMLLFGVPPPDLLPKELKVSATQIYTEKIKDSNGNLDHQFAARNWPQRLCENFVSEVP